MRRGETAGGSTTVGVDVDFFEDTRESTDGIPERLDLIEERQKKILQILLSNYQQRTSEPVMSTGVFSPFTSETGYPHIFIPHYTHREEIIEQIAEPRIETSDPLFIDEEQLQEDIATQFIEQTDIEQIIREKTRLELEQLLSDEDFVQNDTNIPKILHDQYDLTTDTISNLTEFREVVTEFHEEDIKTREKRRLIETSGVLIIGVAIFLLAIGTREMAINVTSSIVVGALLTIVLGISGLGFIAAGILGLNKTLTSDD